MLKEFRHNLLINNLTQNTIDSYCRSINQYLLMYKEIISKKNLLSYKGYLIENYKPKTVNSRILGINKYLEFIKKNDLKLKVIKLQQKTFIENVISNPDYIYFKNKLKENNNMNWYFVVRYLATTGARVSELIQIKIEHINVGYIDLYSKHGKFRRIYIPNSLIIETNEYLNIINLTTGYLFLNKFKERITTRGIAHQLKVLAKEYGINEKVVYPHSFRHLFAKNFLEKYNDITLLADLLGHESIETTRIYLRKSSTEQQTIINSIVDW